MATPIYQCWAKATRAEGDHLKYGMNWAFARRAKPKLFADHLECSDWRVNYADITVALLTSIRSNFVIPGYMLKIETTGQTYHFGLNWGRFWKGELPFPVVREKGKLKYSWLSLITRLVLFGYLVYLLVQRWWNG
jgi:hypothetical protein